MLFVSFAERWRSDAEEWLDRAALASAGSWEREQLVSAAKLNRALADLIDRAGQSAGRQPLLSYVSARPARLRTRIGEAPRQASAVKSDGPKRPKVIGEEMVV